MLNGLRDRIVVQVDGQLKTGRDVVIAALLGAEEFGFATAPLVVSGCIMMRVCHLDTCPVGIATQNPELRARFSGKPEFVETFFEYIAEEVREHLAALGFRTIEEAIGQVELPRHRQGDRPLEGRRSRPDARSSPRSRSPDGSGTAPHGRARTTASRRRSTTSSSPPRRDALDHGDRGDRVAFPIRNVNRTVGTMLGHEVTKVHPKGLPDGTIDSPLTGSGRAVASARSCPPASRCGSTATPTTTSARDCPAAGSSCGRTGLGRSSAEQNVIAGNVIGYGATTGEIFLRGQVGERFCVRNSGATAVVEGVGDHGCEYMTGGTVARPRPDRAQRRGRDVRWRRPTCSTSTTTHVNRELVDLGPLRPEDELVVHDLLERHHAWTDSPVAARLLADWDTARSAFTLVLPRDYQRVLDVRSKAAAEGLDPDGAQVWERIMEASRG